MFLRFVRPLVGLFLCLATVPAAASIAEPTPAPSIALDIPHDIVAADIPAEYMGRGRRHRARYGKPRRSRPHHAPGHVQAAVTAAALRHGVPVHLAHKVARLESGYSCTAKNPRSTAYGPYQIIRGTGIGLGIDRTNCAQNIDGGVRLLRTVMHNPRRLCQTYEVACKRSFWSASL